MKVLSIDWDYFMNVSFENRDKYFPKVNEIENSCPKESFYSWANAYNEFPEIYDIDVNQKEFTVLGEILGNRNSDYDFYYADSHLEIVNLLKNLGGENNSIVHVDHHHDYFDYGGDNINCSNWLRHYDFLFNEKIWVKNKDSQINSLLYPEGVPLVFGEYLLEDFKKDSFDYIFLCRSSPFSPPHLDKYFEELLKIVFLDGYPRIHKLYKRPEIMEFDNF